VIPVAAAAEAHRRLHRALDGLTDEQVRAPSPLPGWTRGHVLAHAGGCDGYEQRVDRRKGEA